MSWEIQELIWKMPVTNGFTSAMKYTALAYANFAQADGTSVYPSIRLLSQMTGYHERSIQEYKSRLIDLGILVPDGLGPKGTNRFRFPVEVIAGEICLSVRGVVYNHPERKSPQGDGVTQGRGEIPSGELPSGGQGSPKPSNPKKTTTTTTGGGGGEEWKYGISSSSAAVPLFKSEIGRVTPAIEKELSEAVKIYPLEWVQDAIREASLSNVRNWKYCKAILERWEQDGKEESRIKTVRPAWQR